MKQSDGSVAYGPEPGEVDMRFPAILISLLSFLSFSSTAYTNTWYIVPDGSGDAPTIQAGVDSAAIGDTLLLADGDFQGVGNREVLITGVLYVLSENDDPSTCLIRAGSLDAITFNVSGSPGTLRGVTITEARNAVQLYNPAGIAIENCVLRNNNAQRGAGIYATSGQFTVEDCEFRENTGDQGAIYTSAQRTNVLSCLFVDNTALDGAAIYWLGGDIFVRNSTFIGNTATVHGGAIHLRGVDNVLIKNTLMVGNVAGGRGGAIHARFGSIPKVRDCTLVYNEAAEGAGISCTDGASPDIVRTIIAFSEAGEPVFCEGSVPVLSCTDVYGNAAGDWVGCIAGVDSVNGNLSLDPLFCDTAAGDFTLDAFSPCLADTSCGVIGKFDKGCDVVTGVADGEVLPDSRLWLAPNAPNPFNPTTRIRFSLSRTSPVILTIHDVAGRTVRTIVDDTWPEGQHEVTWTGIDSKGNPVRSGVYFARLMSGDITRSIRMILLR